MKRLTPSWTPALLAIGLAVGALTLSACQQPVEQVLPQPVTDITAYFWTGTGARMQFDTNGKTTNSLQFSAGVNGGLTVQDYNIGTLQCQVSKDAISASGFGRGSVIDLDPYSFFSALDTQLSIPVKMSAAVIVNGGYFAATDHGLWMNKTTWQQDLASAPPINHFAFDASSNVLYAATVSGQVMQKSLASGTATWTTLPASPGPLNALIFYKGALFAAQAGGTGVVQWIPGTSTSWRQTTYTLGEEVTALFPYTGSYPILVGTLHGKVYGMSPTAGISTSSPGLNCNSRINCFLTFNGGVAAGTDSGLFKSAHGSDGWTRICATAPIQSVAQRPGAKYGDRDSLCFISNGTIYWVDTSGAPVPARAIPTSSQALGFVSEGSSVNATVVTELSLCNSTGMRSGGWIRAADTIPVQHPETPGGLVLLLGDHTQDNASWRAGTLVTYKNWRSFAITGRMMEHLDSLQITNGALTKSYPDVLVVRYAHELAGGSAESDAIPYWVVYYQKGLGPIMFEKQEAGRNLRRQLHP